MLPTRFPEAAENIPKAREVLIKAVGTLDGVAQDPLPRVIVTGLGASSVDMEVRVWIHDAGDEKPIYYAVMEASKLALDEANIEIPYHHLQLFVENIEDRVWESAARLAGNRGTS
jgi:small conductance mechanosensitive channel